MLLEAVIQKKVNGKIIDIWKYPKKERMKMEKQHVWRI